MQVRLEQIKQDDKVSKQRKCQLLEVNRSRLYYKKKPISEHDIEIMNEMRDIYIQYPFFGYRKIHAILGRNGYKHNIKKTERLASLANLKAIYPKKKTTIRDKSHSVFPYLLKNMDIIRPNQAWQIDITYIKIRFGFVYLVCLIDIFSRRIMGWCLSPFLDTNSCIDALDSALNYAKPEIINSDQGCQFTSHIWHNKLSNHQIQISMDGKGRWADNIYIERLWRSIKYEMIYLNRFDTVLETKTALESYVAFYNDKRPHQALNYYTPNEIYYKLKNEGGKTIGLEHLSMQSLKLS